jgi:hypothetical protein
MYNIMDKHAKELAQSIHDMFASAYAIDEKVSHEWLTNTIHATLTAVAEEAKREERNRIFEELHSLFMESNGFEDRTVKLHTYIYKQLREDY